MVDLCLHSIFLHHQDALHPVAQGDHRWSPSLRHHAASNAVIRHLHCHRHPGERGTRLVCHCRVSPVYDVPSSRLGQVAN
jgi:hypothetical protein